MQVNDLVKVIGPFVQEYALVVELIDNKGLSSVKVRYFDGEEEVLHPTQVRVVRGNR